MDENKRREDRDQLERDFRRVQNALDKFDLEHPTIGLDATVLNRESDAPASDNRLPFAERIRRTEERIATLDDILRATRRGLALLPPDSLEHHRGEQDVLLLEAERDGLKNLLRGLQNATRGEAERE